MVSSKWKKQICIVEKIVLTGSDQPRYKVHPLNRKSTSKFAENDPEQIHSLPANMPRTPGDVDTQIMFHCLSSDVVETLRSRKTDSTISYEDRATLY